MDICSMRGSNGILDHFIIRTKITQTISKMANEKSHNQNDKRWIIKEFSDHGTVKKGLNEILRSIE